MKLQAASATALPALDPFKPPSTVTQIVLVSNPLGACAAALRRGTHAAQTQIRIRFKVKYAANGAVVEDGGEVTIPES